MQLSTFYVYFAYMAILVAVIYLATYTDGLTIYHNPYLDYRSMLPENPQGFRTILFFIIF